MEWHDDVEAVREDFPEVVDNYFNNNNVEDIAPKSNVVYTDDENFVCNMNHKDYSVLTKKSLIICIGLMVLV